MTSVLPGPCPPCTWLGEAWPRTLAIETSVLAEGHWAQLLAVGSDMSSRLSFPHLQMVGDLGDLPRPVGGSGWEVGREWTQWVWGGWLFVPAVRGLREPPFPNLSTGLHS